MEYEQSRDTGNIENKTQNKYTQNKAKITTRKIKTKATRALSNNPGQDQGAHE